MKRIVTSSILAASLLAAGAAHASPIVLTAAADTYVKLDNKEGYGSSIQIAVDKFGDGAGGDTRKGVIKFVKPDATPVRAATLSLDVLGFADPGSLTSATFLVWGVKEVAGCAEDFSEGSADYRSFSYFDSSGDGVINSGSCLYDGNLANVDASPLGTFTVKNTDVGKTVTFSSQALIDFINSDTNGIVTIAITSGTNSSSLVTTFASKEHTTRSPARLSLDQVGRLSLRDSQAFVGTMSTTSSGKKHFEGTLRIPVAGGLRVTVPNARVDMTVDASGDVETISGWVGVPQLPALALFSALGPLASGGDLWIGYDVPSEFNYHADDYLGLPLSSSTKYFYFLLGTGQTVEWGPLSMSSPGTGTSFLALAPNEPTFYGYTDHISDGPVSAAAIGVSGGNAIPFQPTYTKYVEPYMVSFDGDLYLGASVAIPTPLPDVSITVEGGMTVNVDEDAFANGSYESISEVINALGANAEVGVEAALGDFAALSMHMGGASVLYRRDEPSLTFAGKVDPDKFFGIPLLIDGQAWVSGYFDGTSQSYLLIDGDLKFPLSQQEIAAVIQIDDTGATFDGKAIYGFTTIKVKGEVNASYATFSGSTSYKFNAYGGSVKATIRVWGDTRSADPGVGADAKFCVKVADLNPPDFSHDECSSVSADATLTDGGRIKVCAQIPGYGKACDTLN